MIWLYLVVMIFSALTLYFIYGEYKQNRFSKKAFTLVSIMEIVVIVAIAVMLIIACTTIDNKNEKASEKTAETTDNSVEMPIPDSTTEESTEDQFILADLNHDGTEDKIMIAYEDEQKNSAAIKVIDGKNDMELMSDVLKINANKVGAYYLQKGKGNERDRLVFWHYGYLSSGRLAFNYSVFSYEPDGKIIYGDRGGKTFDVSFDAAIASGNQVFLVMIKEINDNIQASRSHYNGYLLLDNRGESVVISTAENMIQPEDLTFELEDFVMDKSGE